MKVSTLHLGVVYDWWLCQSDVYMAEMYSKIMQLVNDMFTMYTTTQYTYV